jgi:hypothetical protein
MKIPANRFTTETVPSVLLFSGIYLALWVSGFRDTDRRWFLFVCLFGVLVAQQVAFGLGARLGVGVREARGATATVQVRARAMQVICGLTVMMIIALVLRFSPQ